MEPEWNNPDRYSDAVMLGLRYCNSSKSYSILKNRHFLKRFSFKKRKCYFSGENLTWKMAYIARKELCSLINKNKPEYDDIWISQKFFDNINEYIHISK